MLSFWQPRESILNFSLQKVGGRGASVGLLCWSLGLVFFRPQAFRGFCPKAQHMQETLELPLRYEALLAKVLKTGTQDKSLPSVRPDLLGLRSRPHSGSNLGFSVKDPPCALLPSHTAPPWAWQSSQGPFSACLFKDHSFYQAGFHVPDTQPEFISLLCI